METAPPCIYLSLSQTSEAKMWQCGFTQNKTWPIHQKAKVAALQTQVPHSWHHCPLWLSPFKIKKKFCGFLHAPNPPCTTSMDKEFVSIAGEERKRMLTKRTTRWVRLLSNLFNKMGETTQSAFPLLLLASIRVCSNHRFQAHMKLVLWSYCLRHEDLLTIRMHAWQKQINNSVIVVTHTLIRSVGSWRRILSQEVKKSIWLNREKNLFKEHKLSSLDM